MFHIFFLIALATGGAPQIAMSNEAYADKTTCVSMIDKRVEAGNNLLIPQGHHIVAAMCATEDEMKRKASEQGA